MNDLISRKEAINAICAICGMDCDKTEFRYNCPQDEQVILCPEHYVLCRLPSASQWIPCSERLPDDGTEVFVYLFDKSPSPYIAWIDDSRWQTEEFEVEPEHYPLAWMPLPESYREE